MVWYSVKANVKVYAGDSILYESSDSDWENWD